jgi:hypothetical protein
MKSLLRYTLSITASATIAVLTTGTAFGQASKVSGEAPVFEDLQSPQFSGGGKEKRFAPKDWLEIEAKLRVELSPTPETKICDKITVKWYVAVRNPEKPTSLLLFTKDVEHVNIPLAEDIYCSVYLSPGSIKRLTGSDKGGKGAVEYVGYEVLVNGEKKAEETSKGKKGWWNTASDKISRSEAVTLLNKSETPFSNMWWDRYAEISVTRR